VCFTGEVHTQYWYAKLVLDFDILRSAAVDQYVSISEGASECGSVIR
jgi:hypothetical protein